MSNVRIEAGKTYRKRADSEIDACITNGTLFGFRKIISHAPWDGHLRQVVVECQCGKRETVKYAWLKSKVKIGKMRQCLGCGNKSKESKDGKPRRSKALSEKYLKLNPVCARCGSTDRLHVDHIIPIRDRPDLIKDFSNFQTLCADCHADKTAIEDGIPRARNMIKIGVKSR